MPRPRSYGHRLRSTHSWRRRFRRYLRHQRGLQLRRPWTTVGWHRSWQLVRHRPWRARRTRLRLLRLLLKLLLLLLLLLLRLLMLWRQLVRLLRLLLEVGLWLRLLVLLRLSRDGGGATEGDLTSLKHYACDLLR